ncbi:MAG: glycosyltransferase family 9 protein [Candidatus Omnitrophica bacterium]|nr:glycosyltransferase family 9 protein [Candidatus Omnitrophota bacterium]
MFKEDIRRILFIRTDRLGDVLMNLPAIRVLRQTFPKAWIALLAKPSVAPLFRHHPDLDEVIVLDSGAAEKIKKARFDLAIISNPDKSLHWLMFVSHIRHRVGYDRKWGFLLTRKIKDEKDKAERHEMDYNLELIHLVSAVSWDGEMILGEDPAARKEIEGRLADRAGAAPAGWIAIHPGTSHPAKRWDPRRFAALCSMIACQTPFKPLLIGGEEERRVSAEVADYSPEPVLDWTGRLTLPELAAFFKNSRVKALVSSDSGPVHLAWMSGVPVVALYAKNAAGSNPARWGPRGVASRAIYKPIFEIDPEEVFACLREVLAR